MVDKLENDIYEIGQDGTKYAIVDGKYHMEGAPAIIFRDGTKQWRIKNKLHREDGPAVERPDDEDQWWLYSRRYTEHDFKLFMILKSCGYDKKIIIELLKGYYER